MNSTSTEALKKIMEGMAQVCEGIAEQLAILQEEIEEVLEESIPDEEPEPLKKDLTPISTGRKGSAKSTQRKTPARKKKDAPVKDDASAKADKPEIAIPEDEKAVTEETAVETAGAENAGADTTENNEPLQEEAAESKEEEAAEDSRPPVDTGPGDKAPGDRASTDTPSDAESSAVALTMDDLTSVIVAKIKQHRPNSEKIQKIVQSYGVEKLPDLPASKYESFLADVSKL